MPLRNTLELYLDPDIELKAKKFNLRLSFHYGSSEGDNAQYGFRRSASVNMRIQSLTSTALRLVQADFQNMDYTKVGTSGGITTYAANTDSGATSTLSFDGTNFTQYVNDGMKLTYGTVTAGGDFLLQKVTDPSGVAHTYSYGTGAEVGLLKTIEVPGGNKVTFLYSASSPTSLLNAVQDWSGRRWTFQYDTNRCLTTETSPLGCTTKYGYINQAFAQRINFIEDPRGYRTTYSYIGERINVVNAGGARWTWVYDSVAKRTTLMTPSGALTMYNFESHNMYANVLNPKGYTSTFTFSNLVKTKAQVPAGVTGSLANSARAPWPRRRVEKASPLAMHV